MKRVLTLIAAMALGVAMTVATPASAAPGSTPNEVGVQAWWDCPDGYFCAWYWADGNDKGEDGEPDFYGKIQASDLNVFGLNDHVRSVWNRTGVVWCAYPDKNFSDVNGTRAPNPWPIGNWRGNTSQYGMQNDISSLRRGNC